MKVEERVNMNLVLAVAWLLHLNIVFGFAHIHGFGEQPLSRIAIHKAVVSLHSRASITATPSLLGKKGEDTQWVTVDVDYPDPSADDWVGVFSPAKFNASTCPSVNDPKEVIPYICSAPIKYKFTNYSNSHYTKTGKASLKFQLINQRADFSFALFSGGLLNPKLVAVSNFISFVNPRVPLYPRLAQGKSWDEMTVTWTSGYHINEAIPFVEWGPKGKTQVQSPAGTLTFSRNSMCGMVYLVKTPSHSNGFLLHTWTDPVNIFKKT